MGAAGRMVTIAVAILFGVGAGYAFNWMRRPRALSYAEVLQSYQKFDPKVGAIVDLGAGSGAPEITASARVAVLLLGSCSACSTRSEELTSSALRKFQRILVVTTADKLPYSPVPNNVTRIELVSDDKLHSALNAYFTPRAAIFDGNGALVALQSQDQTMRQFLEVVK